MEDVQNRIADISLPINSVGIRKLRLPIKVSDKSTGSQNTIATLELGVDLPAEFKGTHMSRFVEALENWNEDLSYTSLKKILENIRVRLQANQAQIVFHFPFFIKRTPPVTTTTTMQGYDCTIKGKLDSSGKVSFELGVTVPVMTVCPCSKAISLEGAHSQRAYIKICAKLKGFSWLEEFIEIAESSGSSPTYPLLKREDEKFVTETAFANPFFVEDVVRNVAAKLKKHPQISWFKVEVESEESIHSHNAFARIEKTII